MPTRSSLQGKAAAYFHVRPKASRCRIEYGLIAAGIVAHDVVVRLHLDGPWRRETAGGHLASAEAAPKQQSRRRRLSANGFAFVPNAVLPGRQWGVEPAVGESPHLLSPSCVTGDEGSDPTTKAYDPRSRPQAAFLRPWNRPIIAARISAGRTELELPAGSTERILSR